MHKFPHFLCNDPFLSLIFLFILFCFFTLYFFLEYRMWSDADTKALTDVKTEIDNLFHGSKCHKTIWQDIAKRLHDMDVQVTAGQCKTKWKGLKNVYRKPLTKTTGWIQKEKNVNLWPKWTSSMGTKLRRTHRQL